MVVITSLVVVSVMVVEDRVAVVRVGNGVTVMKSPSSSHGMGIAEFCRLITFLSDISRARCFVRRRKVFFPDGEDDVAKI
jgi:hypothetical protein